MDNTSSMDGVDGDEVDKFNFFKKRRQKVTARNVLDSSEMYLTLGGNSMKSFQGLSQGTNSSPENSRSNRRKKLDSHTFNSFRGILKDFDEDKSHPDKSQSTNENTIDLSDMMDDLHGTINPDLPSIDLRKCVPVRDQLLYGNINISILHENERKVEELLHQHKLKIENLRKNPGINNNLVEILRLLYSRHMSLYKSYLNLVKEGDFHTIHTSFTNTNGVYVRVLKTESQQSYESIDLGQFSQLDMGYLTHDNIVFNFINQSLQNDESTIYIGEHYIQGPTFINSTHLPLNVPIEFLPIKITKDYLTDWPENLHRKEAITQSLWDRATKELIIVKALVNIPSIPLAIFEGFDIYNISAGERFWAPLYLAERLCYLGLVYIEIPIWLLPDFLKEFLEKENTENGLSKLPCDYFFEIAYAFMSLSLFKRICFPPSKAKLSEYSLFSIISKSSGIIEDIKGCRENKIHNFISTLKSENFFSMQNLQFSETYIISQFLGAFWPPKIKYKSISDSKSWKRHLKEMSKELKNIAINSI